LYGIDWIVRREEGTAVYRNCKRWLGQSAEHTGLVGVTLR